MTLTSISLGFPGIQTVKNQPAMQETPGLTTGGEDPLQKGEWLPTPVFL